MKTFTIHCQVGYEKGAFLKLLAGIKTSDFKRFGKLTQFVVYVYMCVWFMYNADICLHALGSLVCLQFY